MPREPISRVLRPRPPPVEEMEDTTPPPETHPDLIPSLPAIHQKSCFLFTTFPPEIRNRIYTFSLESEDIQTTTITEQEQDQSTSTSTPSHLYRQNAFYYRPGHFQPKRICTALLQTCQQIYNEASLLPPSVNKHTFWFYRGPPHIKDASCPLAYFGKMSASQRAQVHHLHLFTQQYFLEDNYWSTVWQGTLIDNLNPNPNPDSNFNYRRGRRNRRVQVNHNYNITPKKMTITLRHTDWWFWENNEPLGIDPFRTGRTRAHEMGRPQIDPFNAHTHQSKRAWGNQFIHIPSLEELVIEFETIMRKRDQLDAIIQQALSWKFPLQLEKTLYLVADPCSRRAYTWVGAKEGDLKKQETVSSPVSTPESVVVPAVPVLRPFDPQDGGQVDVDATATATAGGQVEVESNTEEFYVVFLTWKRQVVEE